MNLIRRIFFKSLFLIFVTVSFFTGCIYRDVRVPGLAANLTLYQLNSDDYRILGTVETEGVYTSYFALVLTGDTGYSELLEKSKKMGGDDIINYRFEVQSTSVLMFVFNRVVWKASALAIQYKDKIKK